MLYQQWTAILDRYREEIAIHELHESRSYTFADLQDLVNSQKPLAVGQWHSASIAQGFVPFIVQTLRAWRDHAVFCALEKEEHEWAFPLKFPPGIAHLKLTSGSTGQAKCVMMTAEQLAADAENLRVSMKLNRDYPNLAVISAAHSYGFSNLVTPLLLQGHPVTVVPDALPASLRKAFELPFRYILPAVPAMWQAWHKLGLLQNAPIHLAISAGAPLSTDLETQVFESSGLKIHNFYGSSECGGIAYDDSQTPRTESSFVGRKIHRVELSVNRDTCLEVSGPAVAQGYLDDPDQIHSALSMGVFRTSDEVELRGDAVYLLGRVSDAINIAGRKLNPQDVEVALLKYPGIKHAIVFGIPSPDPARCEECIACLNVEPSFIEVDLQKHLGELLAMWQKPRHLWINSELAPDARGKISRKFWKQQYLARS